MTRVRLSSLPGTDEKTTADDEGVRKLPFGYLPAPGYVTQNKPSERSSGYTSGSAAEFIQSCSPFVVLGGDPPRGEDKWEATEGGFTKCSGSCRVCLR